MHTDAPTTRTHHTPPPHAPTRPHHTHPPHAPTRPHSPPPLPTYHTRAHHVPANDVVTSRRDFPGERSKEFCCVFKDPDDFSKQKQYHYEAMTNHEAAEIVAKLDYLMQMQTQASR